VSIRTLVTFSRIASVALASCLVLMGCGSVLDLTRSELDAYAGDVDRICVESFQDGIEGEEDAEETGSEMGWSGPRIEAEIRYAWADALVGQYRKIAALGPAPESAALMRRWARTSLERSRLYRRIGDAWLESDRRRAAAFDTDLRVAKLMADHLAQPLPLRICGRPTTGEDPERVPPGQLVGYAPLRYTAEFPLRSAPVLRRAVDVYWRHRVAGRVVRRVPGSETVLVEIRLRPRFARSVIGSELQLFRARRDPGVSWIGIVPARE
jgi:hypothetical protein